MSKRSTSTSVLLGLLAVSAAAACGPESPRVDYPQDAGYGGAAGMGGSGGAVVADAGTGGAPTDAGMSETGGTDDAGPVDAGPDDGGPVDAGVDTTFDGGVDVPPETCGPDGHGCAKLSVPLTDPQTGTFFAIGIPTTDLSGVSAVFRFCMVPPATHGSGWVQPYAQEGVTPFNGQFDTVPFSSIAACPTFLEYTLNFSNAPDPGSDAGSPWFTRAQILGLKIQSLDGTTGSWTNPTVVYVDSITLYRRGVDGGAPDDSGAPGVDGGGPDDGGAPGMDGGAPDDGGVTPDSGALPPLPGPFTFDTSSAPFSVSPYQAVPGSALDWVP